MPTHLNCILLIYRCYDFAVDNQDSTNIAWRLNLHWSERAGYGCENAPETLEL